MSTRRLSREESRARTRAAVLEAAAEVFASRGFDGASMEEVAVTAGFTRGAVYSNFADKADLVLAVLDERERRRTEEVEAMFRSATDPTGFFAALAASNRDRTEEFERWTMLGLEIRLYAMRNPEIRPRLAERNRALVDTVARGVQAVLDVAGVPSPRPVEEVALIIQALDEGLAARRMVDPAMVRPDLLLDTLLLLLEAAVAIDRQAKATEATAATASGSGRGSGRPRRRHG